MANTPQDLTLAAYLQARYDEEKQQDAFEARRLVELRDTLAERSLTPAEGLEQLQLERAREDRAPRLRQWQYEAQVAQQDLDIDQVVSGWDDLVAEKEAAYQAVEYVITGLLATWKRVFEVHRKEEEAWRLLPTDGSSLSTFPSGSELALWITSRMPRGWDGILTDQHFLVWDIDWASVKDIDPGLKPLEHSSVGRIRDRAQSHRMKMVQTTDVAQDAAEEEEYV